MTVNVHVERLVLDGLDDLGPRQRVALVEALRTELGRMAWRTPESRHLASVTTAPVGRSSDPVAFGAGLGRAVRGAIAPE